MHMDYLQIYGATVQYIIATAPWRQVFVHPCATTLGVRPSIPLQSTCTVGSDDHVTNDYTSKRFGLANIVRREMLRHRSVGTERADQNYNILSIHGIFSEASLEYMYKKSFNYPTARHRKIN